jgi:transcriptional regulator with XRE-family HTH domain
MFYDDIYRVCNEKDTKPTAVLRELNLSTGNISKWKNGASPTVETATRIAKHLGVSLSYLCNPSDVVEVRYPPKYQKWIDVIDRIPDERKGMCLDFLKTHMTIPEKYLDKKNA